MIRSHKEKRSAYAPAEKSVRYDGVYRIEKCWRKVGIQVWLRLIILIVLILFFSELLLCVFCRAKGSVVTFSSGVTTNQLHGPGLIYFLLLKPSFSVFSSYASTLSYILQWWAWWSSKTSAFNPRAQEGHRYVCENGKPIMGFWCKHCTSSLFFLVINSDGNTDDIHLLVSGSWWSLEVDEVSTC